MYSEWFRHLNTQIDKDLFKMKLSESKTVLNRLKDVLQEKEETLDRSETNQDTYNIPSWAYLQAHKNGYREALAYLKKLVDIDQQRS